MREIVFDTETTGINPEEDRLIEIGCVEIENLLPTGREFHCLIDPGREVHPDAVRVHGHTWEKLKQFPKFSDPTIVDAFLAFVGDSRLVAHNASFDRSFINAELIRSGRPALGEGRFIDTLKLARSRYPGSPASLDALCRRFDISIEHRSLHGAIKDSRLLAEVYLQLNGGRERSFGFEVATAERVESVEVGMAARPAPLAQRLSDTELEAHRAMVAQMGDKSFWARLLDRTGSQ